MARISKLPPPPAEPVRSPPVKIAGEDSVLLEGTGGALEVRVHVPSDATRAVVIAHPHPLYGGSMHSPVPLAIAKVLVERERVAYARFNFRGVPGSTGTHDDGKGEVEDVRRVIEDLRARAPNASLCVCGHSFGSWVGLRAAVLDGNVDRVALVAPSIRFFEFDGRLGEPFHGRLAIFLGDNDEYCDVDEGRALAKMLGAELRVFEGFDHHFMKSRRALAEAVAPFVAPDTAM